MINLNLRDKTLILMFIVSIMVFTYFCFFLKQQFENIRVYQSRHSVLNQELNAKQRFKMLVKELGVDVKNRIPSQKNIPQILQELDSLIKNNELKQLEIVTNKEILKEKYCVVPVKIRIQGSYSNIKQFLKGLEQTKRLLDICEFKLKFSDNTASLDMILNAYSTR